MDMIQKLGLMGAHNLQDRKDLESEAAGYRENLPRFINSDIGDSSAAALKSNENQANNMNTTNSQAAAAHPLEADEVCAVNVMSQPGLPKNTDSLRIQEKEEGINGICSNFKSSYSNKMSIKRFHTDYCELTRQLNTNLPTEAASHCFCTCGHISGVSLSMAPSITESTGSKQRKDSQATPIKIAIIITVVCVIPIFVILIVLKLKLSENQQCFEFDKSHHPFAGFGVQGEMSPPNQKMIHAVLRTKVDHTCRSPLLFTTAGGYFFFKPLDQVQNGKESQDQPEAQTINATNEEKNWVVRPRFTEKEVFKDERLTRGMCNCLWGHRIMAYMVSLQFCVDGTVEKINSLDDVTEAVKRYHGSQFRTLYDRLLLDEKQAEKLVLCRQYCYNIVRFVDYFLRQSLNNQKIPSQNACEHLPDENCLDFPFKEQSQDETPLGPGGCTAHSLQIRPTDF